MRVLFLILIVVILATASGPRSAALLQGKPTPDGPPPGWPARIDVPIPPAAATPDLPVASLTEPFAIGEALYDPARAGHAVVSLLELLGVAIEDGNGRIVKPGRTQGGAPFRLTQEEARAFVEIAEESARLGTENALTFADLHRAVARKLPGWTAERLADAYSAAYERRPDDLVPRVMMGQPITADMPLLFPQAWLLLIDGFAPPLRPNTAARLVPPSGNARLVLANFSQTTLQQIEWGTMSRATQALQSLPRDATFETVASRIGFWLWAHAPRVQPDPARAHEGHGGPGAAVGFSATLDASLPPIRNHAGQVIHFFRPRNPPALAGLDMTWSSWDEGKLYAHGSLSASLGQPMTSDASGTVRISYRPKPETARGRGGLVRDAAMLYVSVPARQMADALFANPIGTGLAEWLTPAEVKSSGRLNIEWHELETIELSIQNVYAVQLPIPGVTAFRSGRDTVKGTLAKSPEGTWHGVVQGTVDGQLQVLQGYGQGCGTTRIFYEQDLTVVGTSIDRLGISTPTGGTHPRSTYQSIVNQPGADKLSLEFVPASIPRYRGNRSDCWPVIPTPLSQWAFIPFNDAQWTIEHAGYGIQLPDEGELSYVENASLNAFNSTWYVTMNRRKLEP